MISDEEWNALSEEEKERRKKEFEQRLREVLSGYDKETCKAALEAVLDDMKKGGQS